MGVNAAVGWRSCRLEVAQANSSSLFASIATSLRPSHNFLLIDVETVYEEGKLWAQEQF